MTVPVDEYTEIVKEIGEIELPCFYAEWSNCGPGQARWIMHVRCPACGCSVQRLACGPCKGILEHSEAGVTCPACDEFIAPARHAFSRIEWLK